MDPNPFKHPAIMLAMIRDGVEPSLAAAGFQLERRNKPDSPVYLYLDYSRGNDLMRLAWDRRDSDKFIGFVAEFITDSATLESISTDLSNIAKSRHREATAEIQTQIDAFVESVNGYLADITP